MNILRSHMRLTCETSWKRLCDHYLARHKRPGFLVLPRQEFYATRVHDNVLYVSRSSSSVLESCSARIEKGVNEFDIFVVCRPHLRSLILPLFGIVCSFALSQYLGQSALVSILIAALAAIVTTGFVVFTFNVVVDDLHKEIKSICA